MLSQPSEKPIPPTALFPATPSGRMTTSHASASGRAVNPLSTLIPIARFYMVLGRVEPALEASQPEEQHGFRRDRRLEEHLVSANLVIDKLLAVVDCQPGFVQSI